MPKWLSALDLVQIVDVAVAMLGQGLVQNFSYHAFLGRLVDLVSRKQYGERTKSQIGEVRSKLIILCSW